MFHHEEALSSLGTACHRTLDLVWFLVAATIALALEPWPHSARTQVVHAPNAEPGALKSTLQLQSVKSMSDLETRSCPTQSLRRGLARHAGNLRRLLVTPRRSDARLRLEASSRCQYVTHKGLAASSEVFLVTLVMARPAILAEGFSHHSKTNLVCAIAVIV